MTVEEIFIRIGGNYSEAISRFKTDDRLKQFMGLYLRDTSASDLEKAFAIEDYNAAFMAAHTFKGVLGNMAFSELCLLVTELTEYLRNGKDIESAKKLFPLVSAKSHEVENIIKEALS